MYTYAATLSENTNGLARILRVLATCTEYISLLFSYCNILIYPDDKYLWIYLYTVLLYVEV